MHALDNFLNRVIHADCIELMQQFPREAIDLVVTDLPYLVNYKPRDGRRCLNDDNSSWLEPAFRELYRVLKADSFCTCFYGWPWIDQFMQVWKHCGFRPVSHLVWVKSYPSRTGYTQGFHEVAFLLAKGRPPRPTQPIRDVLPWQYTGNPLHPNQKPVSSLVPLIETYSRPGEILLDPFAGSGSTGIAASKTSRRFILIERDFNCYKLARERLERNAE